MPSTRHSPGNTDVARLLRLDGNVLKESHPHSAQILLVMEQEQAPLGVRIKGAMSFVRYEKTKRPLKGEPWQSQERTIARI